MTIPPRIGACKDVAAAGKDIGTLTTKEFFFLVDTFIADIMLDICKGTLTSGIGAIDRSFLLVSLILLHSHISSRFLATVIVARTRISSAVRG